MPFLVLIRICLLHLLFLLYLQLHGRLLHVGNSTEVLNFCIDTFLRRGYFNATKLYTVGGRRVETLWALLENSIVLFEISHEPNTKLANGDDC